MKYFTSFDNINYTFPDGKQRIFNNLSTRIDILDRVLRDNVAFETYSIKDGETPETVAYDAYGDVSFHWVILTVNKIFSLYNDWPKTQAALNDYLITKYKKQTTASDSEVILSDISTNEFLQFAGSPSNQFEDSDGKYGVVFRPHHFEDTKGIQYSFDTALYTGLDVFGNAIIQPTLVPISHFQYEFDLNEAKRNIQLPSIQLVQQIKIELRNVANE
tara:strand:+ start:1484 stop:2134 length:651 start_codon:yes stop_codon:yes gene_type:complete